MKARESKNSKKLFLFIAAAIVLIGGIVFAVFSKGTKEEKVPVLMYHHLLKEKEKNENPKFKNMDSILSVETFEKQMKYLADNGYKTLTLEEFEGFVKHKKKLPDKSVLIIFDDGWKSNYVYAYPILKKYKMHAASFPITSKLKNEEEKFDAKQLQFLSKLDIKKMKDTFEFGSHSHNLHNEISKGKVDFVTKPIADVKKDIELSKNALNTKYFCYPFGAYDENSIKLLKELGFHLAFTTNAGYARPDSKPLEVNSFVMNPQMNMDIFADIVSGKYEEVKK
ncbi:polysaccharide deacetylase family protein [Bacillus sp. TL12]|uniref:polysaccharide deacetylase family protein n=1 Tax=Bacillus sp. TL12 TaxID=2894756 RepID=UPI001F527E40|nr:polysaccharide deacetylase family protein [Bacillus sp. TL12]MCI0766654.1 polysaccharide deacetylase family protein [Bacillus sp. TL12]